MEHANGIDDDPVALYDQKEPIKSVGNGVTFRRNLTSESDIATAVKALSDKVAGRLRQHGLKAGGVKVDIKDPYFKVISRQKQLDTTTWLAEEIAQAAAELIRASWRAGAPIRMLTITAINLTDQLFQEQLSLFGSDSNKREKAEKMELAMDEVRKKYGNSTIGFASVMSNDLGLGEKEPDD